MKLSILMAMDFAILEPAGAGTFHAPWKVIMAHMVSQHLVALNRFELPEMAGGWWQPPV